jgi:hypothetical protein
VQRVCSTRERRLKSVSDLNLVGVRAFVLFRQSLFAFE